MTPLSRTFSRLDYKTLFFFTLMIGIVFLVFIFAFEPFRNIPLLSIIFTGAFAYETPMTLLDKYFVIVIMLTTFTGIFYLLYVLKKNW